MREQNGIVSSIENSTNVRRTATINLPRRISLVTEISLPTTQGGGSLFSLQPSSDHDDRVGLGISVAREICFAVPLVSGGDGVP